MYKYGNVYHTHVMSDKSTIKKKKKTCAINYISNYSYYLSSIFFCDDFKSCLSLKKKMDKIFTNFLCMKSIRFQNSSVLM
jgi:hypothetical protein